MKMKIQKFREGKNIQPKFRSHEGYLFLLGFPFVSQIGVDDLSTSQIETYEEKIIGESISELKIGRKDGLKDQQL
jgi:hypothetical protein